jgi:hypothetical protein
MFDRIQDCIRRFQNYSDDLLDSTGPTFDNSLNAFVTFCETDEVMMSVCKPLKENTKVDIVKWNQELPKVGKFVTPTDENDRLAFLYQLLVNVHNGKVNLHYLGTVIFNAISTNATVSNLNNAVSRPLIRGLKQKLDDLQTEQFGGVAVSTDTPFTVPAEATITGVSAYLGTGPGLEGETQTIIEGLAVRYQEVGERSDKEAFYSKRAKYSFYGFMAALLVTLFLGSPSFVLQRLILPEYLGGALVVVVVTAVLLVVFQRNYNKYKTDREQRLFLTVYSLASELRQYPTPVPISDASEDLEYIIGELDACWRLRFRLAKEVLSSVEDFKKLIRNRLLPALRTGKTDDVKLSAWVLAKLCPLLTDDAPKVAELNEMNEALSNLSEQTNQPEVKLHIKMREWWSRHSMVRLGGVILACVVTGITIAVAGYYLGYPQTGFQTGVAGAIALLGVYVTSQRWKKS